MPIIGRIVLPNHPHHVVQRGNSRQVAFAVAEDYQRYLTGYWSTNRATCGQGVNWEKICPPFPI